MRLLLDMDGPLAAFDAHGWSMIRHRGIETTVSGEHEQTARYFTDHCVNRADRDWFHWTIRQPGWFEGLPVTPGATEGVRSLLDLGVDIWVATKPLEENPTCRDGKAAWLRRHFPMLERKLIIAPDKSVLNGDELLDDAPKIEWCERATWRPVIFATAFNGEGSEWTHLPRWTWGDPIEALVQP